jgi:glycosyltransferase involved in cell wall biosynthesis
MKISIVTSSFNSARTLRSTIEGVLAQSYQDYELIIQDGGSTDGTIELIEEFAPKLGDRLKVESGPDRGIYDGFNRGCKRATGDVIGILNSDDFYTTDEVLATVARTFAEHTDIDAVYADVHYVSSNDLNRIVRYYSSKKFTPERMRMGYIPAHPTFYLRRECLEKYGYYDLDFKVASDFEFLLRLIYIHRIKTYYVEEDWVTMRIGGATTKGLQSHFRIMKDHIRAFHKHNISFNPFLYFWRYIEKLREFR